MDFKEIIMMKDYLKKMLQELSDGSMRMGLKMNIAKTNVMVVDNTTINNVLIENDQGYVYLGQHYSLKEKNQDKEIQRRIMEGWASNTGISSKAISPYA